MSYPSKGLRMCFSAHDSRQLVTSYDGNRVWSVDTGLEGRYIGGGFAVAFSPDNQVLAVETESGRIRLMNPNTGLDYAVLEDPYQHRAFQARFSADGSQLAVTAREAHTIHVWNLRARFANFFSWPNWTSTGRWTPILPLAQSNP